MSSVSPDRLSQISTDWKELFAARSASSNGTTVAQREIVLRYCRAVYHYLLAATRDVHAADDLAQEFALRFLRGDFQRADPAKGRFRDFLKTSLHHLVADHFRARRRTPQPLPEETALPPYEESADSTLAVFLRHWRQGILDRTWQDLQKCDPTGTGMFAVLHWKANAPEGRSADGARELSAALQREITPAGFRQTLHRAREKFAELLPKEVAYSLGTDEPAAVESELAELELLDYCRPLPPPASGGA